MQHIYKTNNKQLRKAMFTVFGGKCFYSGQPVAENEFEIDHVIPKSKGGEDSVYNYVLVAKSINRKKHNKYDAEAATQVLYIIRISYAPKVLKFLEEKINIPKKIDSAVQYFIDNGYDEKEALELKESWISSGGSLAETMFYDIHGGLMFGIQGSIAELDSVDQMECMRECLMSFANDIKERIKEHISDNAEN